MATHRSPQNIAESRLSRQLDDLAAKVAALPPDRQQALMTALTTATRQTRFREKQKKLGRVRPAWWINADLVDAINELAKARGGDGQDALNAILANAIGRLDLVDSAKDHGQETGQ